MKNKIEVCALSVQSRPPMHKFYYFVYIHKVTKCSVTYPGYGELTLNPVRLAFEICGKSKIAGNCFHLNDTCNIAGPKAVGIRTVGFASSFRN